MTQRVFIYWNPHKDIYSMRGTHGRVVDHAPAVHLTGATFP